MAKSKKKRKTRQQAASPFSQRNRSGKTGLDPMDSYKEAGYAEGLFLRNLFTGQLRTRNPVLLVMWAVAGVVLLVPLVAAVYQMGSDASINLIGLLCFVPLGFVGVMCFINVGLSIDARRGNQTRRRRKT